MEVHKRCALLKKTFNSLFLLLLTLPIDKIIVRPIFQKLKQNIYNDRKKVNK